MPIEQTLTEILNKVNLIEQRLQSKELAPPDQILDQQQAADLLGISIATLIQEKKRGKIPYSKAGRRCLYSKNEILKIIQSATK